MIKLHACFFAAFLVMTNLALSEEGHDQINISPFTSSEVQKQLEKYGERELMRYLFLTNIDKGSLFLKEVKKGDSEWLTLFYTLRMKSDGAVSMQLDGSIGYALANNPAETLKIIERLANRSNLYGSAYIEEVCRTVDEGWEDWGDGKKSNVERADNAIKELNKRSKGVKRVNEASLQDVKKQCLDTLDKSIRGWENYKLEKPEVEGHNESSE